MRMQVQKLGNSLALRIPTSFAEDADVEIHWGFIPRGLPRVRHTGGSRYPEGPTGFRVKHGMTGQNRRRYPAACCGVVHSTGGSFLGHLT